MNNRVNVFCTFCGCELTLSEIEKKHSYGLEPFLIMLRIMSHVGLWVAIVLLFAGCAYVRPLSEYQHVSHASDGLGGPGFDALSIGMRIRPMDGVTIDLLEGATVYKVDGMQEMFTGRITVEF